MRERPSYELPDISETHWNAIKEVWDDEERLLQAIQELRDTNGINLLSQTQQHALIDRVASAYNAKILVQADTSMDQFTFGRIFIPHSRKYSEPDIIDTYALSMKELWEKYPYAAQHLSDQLDQDAQVVNPDVYLTSLANIISAPNLDQAAKAGAYAGLSYQVSFGYLPFIKRKMQQLETGSSADALTVLTLLEATANYGEDMDFSEQSSQEIHKLIREYAESDAPALMRRKAESLTERSRTDLLVTEKSVASIHDRDYSRAIILPVSRDHLGIYSRSGDMFGLLPREHHAPYEKTDIIHPAQLDALSLDSSLSDDERTRREAAQRDYALFLDHDVLKGLEHDYGFPITELTTREQLWFVASLREYRKKEEGLVQHFTKTFGIDGARAFLSTEFNDSFRGTILSIAEKFSPDDAKQIFKSFSEIATFAQETADALGKRFFTNDTTYNADAVRAELLTRAKDLLVTAESSDAETITSTLERFKSDIVLFASMFKVTQKGQIVKFEDIRDVHLESVSSQELTDTDKAIMIKILTENWRKQAPELLDSTRKSLEESFTNPQSRFYILRKGKNIAASVRFDEQSDGSLYAGSLNVNDIYRSAGIGEAMLQSTIDSLAKTHVITAHVPAHLPVAMKYVNDFGLKIVGIDEEVQSNGTIARDLKLERDDEKNRHYGAHPHIERFDLSHGDGEIVTEVQRQTERGQVATKYFSDPLNPHLRFIAFEPAIAFAQAARQAA